MPFPDSPLIPAHRLDLRERFDGLRYRARPAMGSLLSTVRSGQTISAAPSSKYKHPWFTQPAWSRGQWVATVLPGFVNGIAPIFRASVAAQKALGNPWEINPLTGKQFFSASVFSNPTQDEAAQTLDLPLYLTPAMPLSFYSLGWGGDANRAVPQFFLNLGAANAPQQPSADDLLSGKASLTDIPQPPSGLRLLRACDFWVHQPRVALTSSVQANISGLLTGTANVFQTLGVALPDPSDRLKIVAGEFVPDTQQIDALSNDFEEPNFDEIPVSTVFLLSPPNIPLNSAPDASWTPYVRDNLFWNLHWAQPSLTYAQQAASATAGLGNLSSSVSGLGIGLGSLIISSFESQISNAEQHALNILEAASLAGTFWTPTGGGSSITPPPAPQPAVTKGLNIYANAAAKQKAAQAALRSQSLEPAFPYGGLPFNTSLFAKS